VSVLPGDGVGLHYDQSMTGTEQATKRRVPAAQRRDELIEAAIVEFAHGGLHGTPVDRIARRVGVAQPYVFSLFPSKRDLFIAAVERGFDRVAETFTEAAATFDPEQYEPGADVLKAIGAAYVRLLGEDRELLMLQLHGYAACDDETIREHVRTFYARLVNHIFELSGASPERVDEFTRTGMFLTIQAAIGVDPSAQCDWIREQLSSA
jgi:AcrR family transcriptional regulator